MTLATSWCARQDLNLHARAMEPKGDVTLVKGFSAVPHRGHSSVKAGLPVFINADQALRSATVSLAV